VGVSPPLSPSARTKARRIAIAAAPASTSHPNPSARRPARPPAPILRRVAAPFALPDEAEDARRVVAELRSALGRASRLHHFAKGSGVAAPQLGIGRDAAVVRTPDGETITLLDPHVIEKSADTDEQHEWCWSFFDVRGKVARSLGIHVAHQDVDGTPRITSSGEAVARLVAHEVDHLHGVLYVDRMPPGACTVRVGDYRGTGARSQC
jgi:peptide deformylase